MMKLAKLHGLVSLVLLALPYVASAQAPVDENGNVVGTYQGESDTTTGNEDIPLLTAGELEELVGPIALYPDDLLAIVLPAATYPLQIIEAARFLEKLEDDPTLKPDPDWDDSVVALLNYPEVVALLNDEIDWTWQLGDAVVAQQTDVVAAVESFRDRAYAAGNLKSDDYQSVSRDDGVIEITPVSEDVIYVPYYEPERVVVYSPRPVYYYYPHAYPVYYYPYPSSYVFDRGFFWGVTTAFTIGWMSDSLHVYHHSYYGHPYYGRSYWDYWWYRRPSITVYNTTYVRNQSVTVNHYYNGDRWQPRYDHRRPARPTQPRVMNRHYYDGARNSTRSGISRSVDARQPIQFRERDTVTRMSTRGQVSERVRESRERIARRSADHREPVAGNARRPASKERPAHTVYSRDTARDRSQSPGRPTSRAVAQRDVRRATPETVSRRQQRPDAAVPAQRQALRRPTQSSPRQTVTDRTPQASAQRQVTRRPAQAAPQRPAVSRATSAAPQRQAARREVRPTPPPQASKESRSTPQQAKSSRASTGGREARNKERRSAR